MSSFRRTIPDFQTANPLYVGAQVFAFVVNSQGEVTDQLASLFAGTRGSQTVANPQILDADGKFERPIYIEQPVSLSVVSATVGTHSTGIVVPIGLWRGFWATATIYNTNDFVAFGDPDFPVIYAASGVFTSRATVQADIDAGDLVKVFDAGLVDLARDQAVDAVNTIQILKAAVDDKAATVATQFTASTTKFNEFRNGYYGPFAAPPSARPDGTAIQDGDTFLRTTAPQGLHYYLAGSWVVPSSDTITLNNKLDKSHEGSGGTGIHPNASTSISGFMSATDKSKLDGVQNGANLYTHPSGDGNKHVPATASGDVNKFLKSAGAAGSDPAWASLTKGDVGLSNVTNTADVDKPVSNAQQAALNAKQNALGFSPVQQGTGVGQGGNTIKIGHDGTGPRITVDATDFGRVWTNLGMATALTSPGYHLFPNGLLLQWGNTGTLGTGITDISFPRFFSQAFAVTLGSQGAATLPRFHCVTAVNPQFFTIKAWSDAGADSTTGAFWIAVGLG